MNYCRICGETKSKDSFYRKNATVCKLCANKQTIEWQKDNPEAVKQIKRRVKLKEKYGLSINEYNKLLEKQGGGCAICGQVSGRRNLDVDHSHTTGKVRGVLCENCNKALGLYRDSVELLEKAIKYLKENSN